MFFVNIQKHTQDKFSIFTQTIVLFHLSLQFLFHAFASRLGTFQYFIVRGWYRLALQQCHHIRTRPVRNGEIEWCIVVIVLLQRAFGIRVIECFDDFERRIVVRRVVQRQIAVIVLLCGPFRIDFEQEFFHIEGTFFPRGKVQGQVSVIVGNGRRFRVGFQQCFRDFQWCPERSGRVEW